MALWVRSQEISLRRGDVTEKASSKRTPPFLGMVGGIHGGIGGGLVFFSFWVLLGSSGVPSGVLPAFFWRSSVLSKARRTPEERQKERQKNPEEPRRRTQKNARRTQKNPEERDRRHVRYCR
jgi:hypothetical protein